MRFQYRRYFRVNLTPAQFAGMVDGLNNLILTDEGQQWWLGIHHIKQPFAVYHPQHAHAPAVIRYPGDGQIDAGKRDPRHGWIDVIERADGGSDMVITYNFAPPDPVLRLLLWEKLLGWLEGQGGKVWEDKLVSDNDNTAQEETQNEVAEPFTGNRAAAVTEPTNDEMGTATPEQETIDAKFIERWANDDITKADIACEFGYGFDWVDDKAFRLRLPPRKRGRKKKSKFTPTFS